MSLFSESLQRFRWGDVEFPAVETSQKGGRAVSEHEQWRRDGAELVDGGRKAYRGKVTAAFLTTIDGYGEDLFPRRLEDLVRAFETQAEVRFAHPLLGTFQAMCTEWEPRLSVGVQNGVYLDFEWVEQRASSVGIVALSVDRGASDPRQDLSATAAAADAALSNAGAPVTPTLAAVSFAALSRVRGVVSYADVGRALDPVTLAVTAAQVALARVPTTSATVLAAWQARAALARTTAAVMRVRASLLPDPSTSRLVATTRAMTLAELSTLVYGTPYRAGDLRASNALAGDVVRAGRAILVLP